MKGSLWPHLQQATGVAAVQHHGREQARTSAHACAALQPQRLHAGRQLGRQPGGLKVHKAQHQRLQSRVEGAGW